jgi:hypothetical protein
MHHKLAKQIQKQKQTKTRPKGMIPERERKALLARMIMINVQVREAPHLIVVCEEMRA